jgi:hypothetical protein
MAVVSARLKRSREWGDTDKPEGKGSKTWLVRCDSRDDGPEVAAAACPGLFSSFSDESPNLKANERSVSELDSAPGDGGTLYEVTLNFSTSSESDGGDEGEEPEDPTDRDIELRLTFDSFEENVFRQKDAIPEAEDTDGNPIDNSSTWGSQNRFAICYSNGVPIPDGLLDVTRDKVVTLSKNVTTDNFARIWTILDGYINCVNQDAFRIYYRGRSFPVAARTCWLADAQSEPGYENGVQYEKIQLVLAIRKDGWKRKVLDQGFAHFEGNDPDWSKPPKPILDANGDPITKPVLLDGRSSAVGTPGAGTKAAWLKFRLKDYARFRLLPINEIR